jgi:nucleotide-binding universal stress UspA family protein
LERAVDLALRNRGRLTVTGVLPELPRHMQLHLTPINPDVVRKIVLRELRARLEKFVEPVRQKPLRLTVETRYGTPFLEIIRAVLRDQRDLVMLTAEGTGELQERLFGSTSLHLMRKCPCPVWVLKPGPQTRFARILAAVDPRDPEHDALNIKIMELATSLAAQEQSELHIMHAWTLPYEERLRNRGSLPKQQLDGMVEQARAEHQARLDALLAKFPLNELKHEVHLIKWPADTAIDHVARMQRVDVIVMGTVCRTGIAGFFIGNTAETVLRDVTCSVLAVKPDGFVTAVKVE